MLQPPPITRRGSPFSVQRRTTAASSAVERGCTSASAGPPSLRNVYAASGSRGFTMSAKSFSCCAGSAMVPSVPAHHRPHLKCRQREGRRRYNKGTRGNAQSEIRNPNLEIRNKFEARNSNVPKQDGFAGFVLRILNLFRISRFGFRDSDFGFWSCEVSMYVVTRELRFCYGHRLL